MFSALTKEYQPLSLSLLLSNRRLQTTRFWSIKGPQQGTQVRSLGLEDPLEEGMATYFSYSCLENPHGQRRLAGYCPLGRKMLDMTERLSTHAYFYHKKLFTYEKRDQDLESTEKVNILISIRRIKTGLLISKFGKLSSGHRTGKGQFSFQSQRRAMPKNAQTTTKLHSSHTLVK